MLLPGLHYSGRQWAWGLLVHVFFMDIPGVVCTLVGGGREALAGPEQLDRRGNKDEGKNKGGDRKRK